MLPSRYVYSSVSSSVVLWSWFGVGDIGADLSIGGAAPEFFGMLLGLPVVVCWLLVGVDVLGLPTCWVGGLGRL